MARHMPICQAKPYSAVGQVTQSCSTRVVQVWTSLQQRQQDGRGDAELLE